MEVTLGFKYGNEPLRLEVDLSAEDLENLFAQANWENTTPVRLTDSKGRVTLVNPKALAWARIGQPTDRKVGFGVH